VTHAGESHALCRSHRSLVTSSVVGCWLVTLACSGATDVVGVLDDTSASSPDGVVTAAPSPDEALAVVQGRPLPDWRGAVQPWPLSTPLRELFAGDPAPAGSPSLFGATGRASWQRVSTKRSRDGTRRFAGAAFASEPSLVGLAGGVMRDARARTEPGTARSVVLRGDAAERLLSLFASAEPDPDMPRAAVVRDDSGDVYGIVLDMEADADTEGGDGSSESDASFDDDGCEGWAGRECMGGRSSR
jgi:hypothetical protein